MCLRMAESIVESIGISQTVSEEHGFHKFSNMINMKLYQKIMKLPS